MAKLRKGSKRYTYLAAVYALRTLKELKITKSKYNYARYIDIYDCLVDIIDGEDEMIEYLEDLRKELGK